jgi:hypothetical protein
MNRPEFESRMAEFRQVIASMPSPQREALEALALETVQRDEQIRRASLEGHRAVERLELAFERLHVACERLRGLAVDARDTLARDAALRQPRPDVN